MSINRMVASSPMPSADRRAGYRAIILAHMIRKKLGAETGGASFDHLGKSSSRGRRADHLNSSVRKTRKYLTPAEVER